MPISVRTEDDNEGGNHITLARFDVPVGMADPAKRIRETRERTNKVRNEKSTPYIQIIAGAMNPRRAGTSGRCCARSTSGQRRARGTGAGLSSAARRSRCSTPSADDRRRGERHPADLRGHLRAGHRRRHRGDPDSRRSATAWRKDSTKSWRWPIDGRTGDGASTPFVPRSTARTRNSWLSSRQRLLNSGGTRCGARQPEAVWSFRRSGAHTQSRRRSAQSRAAMTVPMAHRRLPPCDFRPKSVPRHRNVGCRRRRTACRRRDNLRDRSAAAGTCTYPARSSTNSCPTCRWTSATPSCPRLRRCLGGRVGAGTGGALVTSALFGWPVSLRPAAASGRKHHRHRLRQPPRRGSPSIEGRSGPGVRPGDTGGDGGAAGADSHRR